MSYFFDEALFTASEQLSPSKCVHRERRPMNRLAMLMLALFLPLLLRSYVSGGVVVFNITSREWLWQVRTCLAGCGCAAAAAFQAVAA